MLQSLSGALHCLERTSNDESIPFFDLAEPVQVFWTQLNRQVVIDILLVAGEHLGLPVKVRRARRRQNPLAALLAEQGVALAAGAEVPAVAAGHHHPGDRPAFALLRQR